MSLTMLEVKNAQPKEKPYKLFDGEGLYLLIKPMGGKYWRLAYRFNGKSKTLSFGVFPDVSLSKARDKKQIARDLLKEGIDPAVQKIEDKLLSRTNSENTFKVIAEEWHETNKHKWVSAHANRIKSMLEMHVYDMLGNLPIKDIKPQMVLSAMREVEQQGKHETAHRCNQYINAIFRYAIVTGRAEYNPAADLKGALKPIISKSYAALDINDLPEFWKKLEYNEKRMYEQTRLSIKLMIYTFVRTSELINATWDEIDFKNKRWIIPAKRMKMKRDHVVPLSEQAYIILQKLYAINGKRDFIFPSVAKPKQPMSNNAILVAIKNMGYQYKVTGHGFRSMASTNMYEQEMARSEVIEKQLAHEESNKIKAAYNRAEYLEERTKLMQDWADYVDRVVCGKK